MSDKISDYIKENNDFFITARHHFHEYPELSCQEYETHKYIASFLDSWGIPYEKTGETSIVATIKGKSDKKTIALRGDIDALPIQEKTNLAWKSKHDGVMHACGHDVHATFMLGVAKFLNEQKDCLAGTVKIIFEEGEEIGAGARKIMDANLLDGVDTIAALHDTQELDLGIFSLGYETMSSYGSGGKFIIDTDGKTNAIIVAGELVSAITALASLRLPKSEQIVLVPTVIKPEEFVEELPSKVSVAYNSRTLNLENEPFMQKILTDVAKNVAELFDCRIDIELRKVGNVVNNDRYFTDLATSVIKEHFGENSLLFARPVMSGEDFALFQKTIPGIFIHIGGAVNNEYRVLHTSKTCVDDKILPIGIEFLLRYVAAYFAAPEKH